MSSAAQAAAAVLLAELGGVVLELADGRLQQIHNASLLAQWLGGTTDPALPGDVDTVMRQLLGPRHMSIVITALKELQKTPLQERRDLGTLAGAHMRAGAPAHQFSAVLLPLDGDSASCLLLLRDVAPQQAANHELQEALAAQEAALAVLRAPADSLRMFLGSAAASVSAIRATFRMPARSQDASRKKLGRLQTEAISLGNEARALGLSPLLACCDALADAAMAVQAREAMRGDDLLPLAPRIDAIASAIGLISRIEEQRHDPAPAAEEPVRRVGRGASWHEVSERRWNEFLRRRGEEIGTLARLAMSGAQLVPAFHRRYVDEILAHLLRNALDHGIETPEERLVAGKSAAGRVTIGFSLTDDGGLKMTVHDDGRGFDLSRIGRAAVQSGLLSEESAIRRDAGELVGLIFKPSFTTEGLDEDEGQGRGMAYLCRKITRLGGQITVATKPGRYTQFSIELPESAHGEEPGVGAQIAP